MMALLLTSPFKSSSRRFRSRILRCPAGQLILQMPGADDDGVVTYKSFHTPFQVCRLKADVDCAKHVHKKYIYTYMPVLTCMTGGGCIHNFLSVVLVYFLRHGFGIANFRLLILAVILSLAEYSACCAAPSPAKADAI